MGHLWSIETAAVHSSREPAPKNKAALYQLVLGRRCFPNSPSATCIQLPLLKPSGEKPPGSGRFLTLEECYHTRLWAQAGKDVNENGFEHVICDERIRWGLLTLGAHWVNPQSERFSCLGWPQLTDWEIPCSEELLQALMLLQAHQLHYNAQKITSELYHRTKSKKAWCYMYFYFATQPSIVTT